jgi:hypothetical protein
MATTPQPKAVVSMSMSELGLSEIFIQADTAEQASAAHRLLAEVTPALRALDDAAKKAAAKLSA